MLEIMYIAYIRPLLEYGDVVWDITQHLADKLESVQLAAARVVTGGIHGTSHVALYTETGWETLAGRHRNHRLTLMYKIINGQAPPYQPKILPDSFGD